MKRFIFLLFASVLASCAGFSVVSNPKPSKSSVSNKIIDGKWMLESITHNQRGKFEITLLNDTSKECFEGSTWEFTPNNNRGTYNITKEDCSTGERNFVFVIQRKIGTSGYYEFMLKPTNEEYQSETNKGVTLQLTHLSERTMIWEQTVSIEGKPFVISMNFVK
ncbi:lipocalin family protein [Capnocytophaga felis]|uniref:Uncharacterized protein n=1 Tax=Capnocytophaga felis TaxID=2267611 RepID=A0A5M4B672_9FLAO|nr:lipocalin family protein [Capnocytophaga felis]GET45079.1 hypothetical protein RCZ01_03810 [Capnocytophaga felis]GET47757.1 hypothetical protein RCZ02_05880 [Capnocytophaga felis]